MKGWALTAPLGWFLPSFLRLSGHFILFTWNVQAWLNRMESPLPFINALLWAYLPWAGNSQRQLGFTMQLKGMAVYSPFGRGVCAGAFADSAG